MSLARPSNLCTYTCIYILSHVSNVKRSVLRTTFFCKRRVFCRTQVFCKTVVSRTRELLRNDDLLQNDHRGAYIVYIINSRCRSPLYSRINNYQVDRRCHCASFVTRSVPVRRSAFTNRSEGVRLSFYTTSFDLNVHPRLTTYCTDCNALYIICGSFEIIFIAFSLRPTRLLNNHHRSTIRTSYFASIFNFSFL